MSKSIKKATNNILSGAVDLFVDPLTPQQDFSADKNLINYYQNLDTSLKDGANNLMAQQGYELATTLPNSADYVYSVNASDDARQQAQEATFQSYMGSIVPQFEQQTTDLQTRLANQGIAPGTAAYDSAFGSLYSAQNAAINNAAQQSVLQGQNAYSQSLQDAISAATFSNDARSGALNEINTALQNSLSNYDRVLNQYNAEKGLSTQEAQNWQQGFSNLMSVMEQVAKALGGK